MDYSQALTTLFAAVIGGVVSAIAFFGKARAERRRVLALALADLLEVRHKMAGVSFVLNRMRKHVEVPKELEPLVAQMWERMYPLDPNLHKRYDAAIDLLAGIDPLLAFEMRSKNLTPSLLESARAQGEGAQLDAKSLGEIYAMMASAVTPAVDEAVQALANSHSWMTGRRVRRYLREGPAIPSEVDEMLSQMAAALAVGRAPA